MSDPVSSESATEQVRAESPQEDAVQRRQNLESEADPTTVSTGQVHSTDSHSNMYDSSAGASHDLGPIPPIDSSSAGPSRAPDSFLMVDCSSAGSSRAPDPFLMADCSFAGPSQARDQFPIADYRSVGPSQASDPCTLPEYCIDISADPSDVPDPLPRQGNRDNLTASSRTLGEISSLELYMPAGSSNTSGSILRRQASRAVVNVGVSCKKAVTKLLRTKRFIDDSDEPSQRLSEARISADAVKTFGAPYQVLGADSYRILKSSDEKRASKKPAVSRGVFKFQNKFEEVKTLETSLETSVEVHQTGLHSPLSSCSVRSSFAESTLMESDEGEQMLVSDLHSNLGMESDEGEHMLVSDLHSNLGIESDKGEHRHVSDLHSDLGIESDKGEQMHVSDLHRNLEMESDKGEQVSISDLHSNIGKERDEDE